MFHHVVPNNAGCNSGTGHDQRHMSASVVQKLFVANMTDAVIRHKEDHGVIEFPGVLQSLDNSANFPIGVTHCVQILSPILQNDRIIRQIGRQMNIVRRRHGSKIFQSFRGPLRSVSDVAILPAMQLNLHKERLLRFSRGPMSAVVSRRFVPHEVVIRLGNLHCWSSFHIFVAA